MRTTLRSITRRFVALSRSSVDDGSTDATASRLASLARASQPAVKQTPRNRIMRGIGFIGTIGIAGWIATGVAAAVTVSTLVATNSLPKPIQKFSADVLEIVGIDAPRPIEKERIQSDEKPESKPEQKPDTKPEQKPDTGREESFPTELPISN